MLNLVVLFFCSSYYYTSILVFAESNDFKLLESLSCNVNVLIALTFLVTFDWYASM